MTFFLDSHSTYFDLSLNRIVYLSTSGMQICKKVFATFKDKLHGQYKFIPAVD